MSEVESYIDALPDDRRQALTRVRDVIREAAPGATETIRTLDIGKGCVRFERLDDLPLDLVGKAVSTGAEANRQRAGK